jgi:chitinase
VHRRTLFVLVLLAVAACATPAAAAHHKPNHHKPGHGTTTTTMPITTTTPTTVPVCSPGTPVTVSSGTVLRGCYRSTDTGTPAITINTTQTVELDHARIEHAGIGVYVAQENGSINVHDSTFQKLATAPGAAYPGHRAIYAYGLTRFHVDNNKFIDGDGVYWQAETVSPTEGSFNRNEVYNVGRYLPDSLVNAFQTNNVDLGGLEVAWNKVVNDAGQSDIEDTFNFYESNGTSGAPFDVHHNLIDGGFPPTLGAGAYNGNGIVLADSFGSYQRAHHNWVVRYVNAGVGIPNGSNLEMDNNVVVNSGVINGVPTGPDYGNGMVLWDNASYAGVPTNCSAHDNVVGYMRLNGSLARSDYFMSECGINGNTCSNNTSMADPIDSTDEQAARDAWEAARVAASVTVGPR